MVSALTGIPIKKTHALTGEVTLRGKILPIGGLKEKLLAAKRENVFKILIPSENEKDLVEVPDEIKEGLEIKTLKHVREAIDLILERIPQTVSDDELDNDLPKATKEVIQSSTANDFSTDESNIPHN